MSELLLNPKSKENTNTKANNYPDNYGETKDKDTKTMTFKEIKNNDQHKTNLELTSKTKRLSGVKENLNVKFNRRYESSPMSNNLPKINTLTKSQNFLESNKTSFKVEKKKYDKPEVLFRSSKNIPVILSESPNIAIGSAVTNSQISQKIKQPKYSLALK